MKKKVTVVFDHESRCPYYSSYGKNDPVLCRNPASSSGTCKEETCVAEVVEADQKS